MEHFGFVVTPLCCVYPERLFEKTHLLFFSSLKMQAFSVRPAYLELRTRFFFSFNVAVDKTFVKFV